MPPGVRRRARLVNGTRAWQWSPPGEAGWPADRWIDESLALDSARWCARLAIGRPTTCPPVVFVHGVVVSGLYFQPVATLLDDTFNVYVPDLPGTGRSRISGPVWDIPRLAAGLAGWMDVHALRRAVLVSNSLGGQVLTQLAHERPDLASALILVAPTGDPESRSLTRVIWRGLRTLPQEDVGLWPVWLRDLARSGPVRSLRTLQLALRDPQRERLPQIETPVLVVGGGNDPIAPPEWVEALAGAIPEGRDLLMPGAPHALNFSNPSDLARVIRLVASGVLANDG